MNIPSLKEVVSAEEWALRVDLAACYRLVALYGWSDLIFTHITARVPKSVSGEQHQLLINPYGFLFEEVTASSLVRIDLDGTKLSPSPFDVNRAGVVIHSAVHAAREDVQCVIHTHTRAGVAVSALKCGVLPISQQATLILGSLGYHDYEGIAVNEGEKVRLQKDLGNNSHLMLRNHGLLTVGRTIADAFKAMYTFESTCQIQLAAQSAGEVVNISPSVTDGLSAAIKTMEAGSGVSRGVLAWPALLRRLERLSPGFDS